MKLSVAIAGKNALPSAFVVFRGIEDSIPLASRLGYHGVELALKRPDEISPKVLRSLLQNNNMEISCISTGQVFAELGHSFSDADPDRRKSLIRMFKSFVDLASEFGGMINIGRVRGSIGSRPPNEITALFIDSMIELGTHALEKNVTILIEPVNRYEIDFINSVEQGVDILEQINLPNFKLMPDVFHMNIEDVSIEGELIKHINHIAYIHLADSNRHAPGWGHTDFRSILKNLDKAGYSGWVSIEILPEPEPVSAAKQSADYILSLLNELT